MSNMLAPPRSPQSGRQAMGVFTVRPGAAGRGLGVGGRWWKSWRVKGGGGLGCVCVPVCMPGVDLIVYACM